jgi:hypothetical protein
MFHDPETEKLARVSSYEYDILVELDGIQKEGGDIISDIADVSNTASSDRFVEAQTCKRLTKEYRR